MNYEHSFTYAVALLVVILLDLLSCQWRQLTETDHVRIRLFVIYADCVA